MSFFDKIKGAIFGKAEAATPTSTPAPTGAPTTAASPAAPAQPAAPAPTAAAPASTAPASAGSVDVASILDAAVKKNGQKLDWKRSIVDLLKALDLDSSLSARKELAGELGYTGDTSDSATMNIWLHKAVIKKLSENGGKVPADLLD
jgi:3-oxoacyl-ACP reductase-like protein